MQNQNLQKVKQCRLCAGRESEVGVDARWRLPFGASRMPAVLTSRTPLRKLKKQYTPVPNSGSMVSIQRMDLYIWSLLSQNYADVLVQ